MRPMPLRAVSIFLHAYVGWRIAPELGALWASVAFVALLVVSVITLPYGMRARLTGTSRSLHRLLAWLGLIGMGLFSSLFVLTLLRDLALLGLAVATWRLPNLIASAGDIATVSARLVALVAAAVTLLGFVNARRTAAVVRVDVPIAGLPAALDGFTIAQISDIHIGPTIRRPYVEAIVAAVNRQGADMVAVTGDLVDGSVKELAGHVAPLAELRSRDGTFFVTGNHEYYSGAAAWVEELRRLGVTVLMNEHVVLRRGDAAIVIAGAEIGDAGNH